MGQNASATPRGQTSPTEEAKCLKPPDDPPERRRERNGMITQGRVFTRYTIDRNGEPSCSPVLVSYNKETKSICWTSPDSIRYDPVHSMRIKDVSQVLPGKQTAPLRSSLAADAPSSLCFSIVSSKLHQSIDLEASEVTTAEDFAYAVDYIKGKEAAAAKAKKNYSLPAPPYQMPITQASLSQILNASLLQTNKKLKVPKKSGNPKSKSQKGRGLSKHNPPIHSTATASTTHAPPTRRTQGYTKKKISGKKRKSTKGSPLASRLPIVNSGPRISTPISLPKSEVSTPSASGSSSGFDSETSVSSSGAFSLPSSLDLSATSRVALASLPR